LTTLKKVIDKSRRSFLKALPAAPLAAPSIAQEVARFGNVPSIGPGHYVGTGLDQVGSVDTSWALDQRSKLEKAARGEFNEEDEYYLRTRKDLAQALHYDGLRSVSPVMRAHLHACHVANLKREERKFWAALELKKFLKAHFGGLA